VKKLPVWQAYTRLYYDSKLKALVDWAWRYKYKKEHPEADDNVELPKIPIAWFNETIVIAWEEEDEDVKKECKEYADQIEVPDLELPEEWELDDPIERQKRAEAYEYGK
jgi:hypothetical protein